MKIDLIDLIRDMTEMVSHTRDITIHEVLDAIEYQHDLDELYSTLRDRVKTDPYVSCTIIGNIDDYN